MNAINRNIGARLLTGLWFELFLGLPGLLLFKGEASALWIAFHVLLVPFVAGASLGCRIVRTGRPKTAGRAVRIGLAVGGLSFLGFVVRPEVLVRPEDGSSFSLVGVLWMTLAFAWLPLLMGVAAALLLYVFRGRPEPGARRIAEADRSHPSENSGLDLDKIRKLKKLDRIARSQLVVGILLIAFNALILALGFTYKSADPVSEAVRFLTARGDHFPFGSGAAAAAIAFPKTRSDYVGVGPLLVLGSACIASGLLVLNRLIRARAILWSLHLIFVGAGIAGAVLGLLSALNPYRWNAWVLLLVPNLLLVWSSLRFLRILPSWDLIVRTPSNTSSARWITAVTLGFWVLASAFILFEGPGKPSYTIWNPHTAVSSFGEEIRFSPDGRFLASFLGRELVLFDSRNGRAAYSILGDSDVGHKIAFSRDSRRLGWAAPPTHAVRMWGTPTGTRVWEDSRGKVQIFQLPDTDVGSNPDSGVRALQAQFPTPLGCTCDPSSLSFSPDDRYLMVGARDGTIWRIALATGEFTQAFRAYETSPESWTLFEMAHTRDHRTLVTVGRETKQSTLVCKLWNAETFALKSAFPLGRGSFQLGDPGIWDASFSPEANAIVASEVSGHVYLWDISTGRRLGPVEITPGPVAFTPAGDALILTARTRIEVLAYPSLKPIRTIAPWHRWPPPVPPVLAVSSQGLLATTGGEFPSYGRAIRIWDLGKRRSK